MRRVIEKLKKLSNKQVGLIVGTAVIVIALGACGLVEAFNPFAISVNGKDTVYVDSEQSAQKVVRQIMKEYKADESKVVSLELNKALAYDRLKFWEMLDPDKVMTTDEAVAAIVEDNSDGTPLFEATIVGKTKTKEEYTPEPVYKKDKTMFAGDSRVEEGSGSGTQYVTREITTVNGEVTETEVTDTEIIDEATPEVIYKGTRGLPEGEDWKEYEGTPHITNGTDLVEYGNRFLGNPYKLGKKSLTHGCDCVGFVQGMYKFAGYNLPDTLGSVGRKVSASSMQPGDIIVFYPHHVALYYGNGQVIHAASPSLGICKGHYGGKIKQVRRVF